MKVVYRLFSPCAGLGYGFPEKSFQEAMKSKLDLIAVDCGSMDPGPYYLGAGKSYEKKPNLKQSFDLLLKGALTQHCPLMLGSCGMAGDTPNLEFMLDIARESFEELNIQSLAVAVISSHLDDELLIGDIKELRPLGRMPLLNASDIISCKKVAQMGLAPYIKALDEGAQVIFAGRSCDVAIFAADPVRRGIDPGLAYHAGHILECGAIACDPGSANDCLIAEFRDDDSVVFTPPNRNLRATTYSIAAHSLYEEDHPALQFYPEGILSFLNTSYFTVNDRSAGIRNTVFINKPLTMKIEGSRKAGERYVSLLFCKDLDAIPHSYAVYGRNGVESDPVREGENEVGLLITVRSKSQEVAEGLLTLWKGLFLHLGFPGRRATAGNLAFPLSPSEISYIAKNGEHVSMLIMGTRDPFFQSNLEWIMAEAKNHVELEHSVLSRAGHTEISVVTREEPIMYLETVETTKELAFERHKEDLKKVERFIRRERLSEVGIYAGEFFEWGIYHILSNEKVIREQLFPISIYRCDGRKWKLEREVTASYKPIGVRNGDESVDAEKVHAIHPVHHANAPKGTIPLVDLARIIRSKNAGVNKITYDLFFNTESDYLTALESNLFLKDRMADILEISPDQVIGTYRADECYAIKISVHRSLVSGSLGDRDVFGAQQHAKLLRLNLPVFS
jgi:Domain of unknown function (DUF4387)/Acyclic terpene utilisation family protein AtuA